jgi:hypothetical protein
MRKNIVFAAVVILIVASLYIFSMEEIVPIPSDKDHANITEEKTCLEYHAEGTENPLKKGHPPKYRCFQCHTLQQKEDRKIKFP